VTARGRSGWSAGCRRPPRLGLGGGGCRGAGEGCGGSHQPGRGPHQRQQGQSRRQPPGRLPGAGRPPLQRRGEIGRQRSAVGVALGRVRAQCLEADRLQGPRGVRRQLMGRGGLGGLDRGDQRDQVPGLEGQGTGQRLVEDDAQRPHVCGRGLASHLEGQLLGRHVRRGPDQLTRLGQPLHVTGNGESKVGHPHALLGVDQDVGGLDVAVDDPLSVCVSQRRGRVSHQGHAIHQVERTEGLPEGLGLGYQLVDQVRLSTMLAVSVDLHDAGMVEGRGHLPFALEALELSGGDGPLVEHLERNLAAGGQVLGFVDRSHAAAAQLADHLVCPVYDDACGERGRAAWGRESGLIGGVRGELPVRGRGHVAAWQSRRSRSRGGRGLKPCGLRLVGSCRAK
jgi:hypothetical protein